MKASDLPDPASLALWLAEDVGHGDRTAALIPEATEANGEVITREAMVLCGRKWFEGVFHALDARIQINWLEEEGSLLAPGTRLCLLKGNARSLLTGERTALNLLQTLSGTATVARRYADAVSGTGSRVLDTRKTLPGLRIPQKYAVRCGGCYNHRIGLYDAILIKENHITAAGSITAAINEAHALNSGVLIEVEVETLEQLQEALGAKCERILLDNFDIEQLKRAVEISAGTAELEASGNVTLKNIREIALTGVDYISVGALTKNLHAIDLSMRLKML